MTKNTQDFYSIKITETHVLQFRGDDAEDACQKALDALENGDLILDENSFDGWNAEPIV